MGPPHWPHPWELLPLHQTAIASSSPPNCWPQHPLHLKQQLCGDWGREERDGLEKKCVDREAKGRWKEDSDRNRGLKKTLLDKNFGSGLPKARHASLGVYLFMCKMRHT
jgi:hypothetical protein